MTDLFHAVQVPLVRSICEINNAISDGGLTDEEVATLNRVKQTLVEQSDEVMNLLVQRAAKNT